MTGIDLSPNMEEREDERGYCNILAVGNVESVVLLPAVADPPPALNAPHYADVKVNVVGVNINGSGGRNING